MVDMLRGLLDGRTTRAEVDAWFQRQPPPDSISWAHPRAGAVYDSLVWVNDSDAQLIGEAELRAYLDVLVRGSCCVMDGEALLVIRQPVDELGHLYGLTPVRWWVRGLGWHFELPFASLPTGRHFVASCRAEDRHSLVEIYKRADDPWQDALVDLFEELVIDDEDAAFLHPVVDLSALPIWALWREDDNANKFEMARYRSYAKASKLEKIYRDRGHRQFYWVDPA